MFGGFKIISILTSLILMIVFASFTIYTPQQEQFFLSDNDNLWAVYEKLGKIRFNAVNTSIKGVSAEKGRDIIFKGYSTKQDGTGKTANQSPYFKCTACHNNEKEFNDLSDISAQNRLDYAEKHDLPFLQGSSFYGLVNRKTFYNDDYQKKYGHVPIIKASNTDIRKAIQLCAIQCSQGRELADWEIESILAYYNTIGLKIKDLNLSAEEKEQIETAINSNTALHQAVHTLEGKYLAKSPAHFADHQEYAPLSTAEKTDKERFKNGKLIYDRSCLHCHEAKRYSFFSLDNSKLSFLNLLNRTKANTNGSIHKITRHGTWPLAGKRAYMPLYPTEKMSKDQLNDLKIYVENMAMGNNLLQQ
ncbi:c-type cytochrome [Aureispira anguillae]|uniref:C-type cytochrome n=1 Tax=Aureispira anguillae TaxID=2864201 RepID=A0A915YKH0_9BACT|nr:c-type cytochrome [Aureispira anguillae]BDS14745.1 c-type cytochrome [Aureispira anguillae]